MNKTNGNELFGTNIKRLLRRRHKTQTELARHLYISPGTLYAMLTGRTRLHLDDALKIAEFLGCSVYDFVKLPKVSNDK